MMQRLRFLAWVLWSLGLLTHCVTPTTGGAVADDPDGRVVERSKPEPPPWTALGAGTLRENEAQYVFVELKTRLRDLPLGLKTTQLFAVESIRNAVHAKAREGIESEIRRLPATAVAELDRKLTDSTVEIFGKSARVQDLYFEKIATRIEGLNEYYNVFVYAVFPKAQLHDIYGTLAKKLSYSSDRSLKALGQDLEERSKNGSRTP